VKKVSEFTPHALGRYCLIPFHSRVVPDLLHIVPVGNDAVFDGILQRENTSLGLSFVTHVGITLFHTNHDTWLTGASDKGGKDRARSIISSETSYVTKEARIRFVRQDLS
jgi:hypothetical protein